MDTLLQKARACMDSGEESRARDCAHRAISQEYRSDAPCTAWAEICEDLGLARLAREFYEKALRLSPNNTEALYGLAALLAESGHTEKSVRYLKKLLKLEPAHSESKALLAEHYRNLGFPGQAAVLEPTGTIPEVPSPLRSFNPSVSRGDTQRLMDLFAGRELGFALQEIHPTTGESAYVFQAGSITREIVAAHILGDSTIGIYSLRSDNTVCHAAVTVRIADAMAEGGRRSASVVALFGEKLRRYLVLLGHHAAQLGFPAYAEATGAGQGRLWFFFDGFLHFLKVKRFLKDFLEHAPAAETPLVVEPLLPTQPVGIGWVEQAIPMPLGLDRTTRQRSFFLDREGKVEGEQLKLLHRIRRISPPTLQASSLLWDGRQGGDSVWEGRRNPLFKRLLGCCPVLAELVRKAMSGRMLRREEKVILFYTAGWLEQGTEILQECFHACPDYQYESVRRQAARLKGHPMSCVKIRELVPEITSALNCNCSFDLRGGKYPSPLLHVHPHMVPVAETFVVPEDLSLREAARRYVALRLHREESEKALLRLEKILEKGFTRQSLSSMQVDQFKLLRLDEGNGVSWKMERV